MAGHIPEKIIWVYDTWFDGDTTRIYALATERFSSEHDRTGLHPLFSMIVYSTTQLFSSVTGLAPPKALRLFDASVAAMWLGGLFVVLRMIGCRLFDALVFALLGCVSAASFFWHTVPETWALGSLSILLSIALIAAAQHLKLGLTWYLGASVFSLGITITNWMAGLAVSWVRLPWRRFLLVTVTTLGLVTIGWLLAKWVFPGTEAPSVLNSLKSSWILAPESGGPIHISKVLLLHSLVMPEFWIRPVFGQSGGVMFSVQGASPGSASVFGYLAVWLWGAMLILGLWGFVKSRLSREIRLVLGMILVGQLVLHLLFGKETFLFSLHILPLLILWGATVSLTSLRTLALVLCIMLIPLVGINNYMQFQKAAECFSKVDAAPEPSQEIKEQFPLGVPAQSLCKGD